MAQHALGNVTSASTTVAVQATSNLADPLLPYHCQALQFQALSSNTGSVYICDRYQPNLSLNAYVEIPAPTSTTRPAWTIGNPAGANPLDATTFWILPAVGGEGVRVTAVRT